MKRFLTILVLAISLVSTETMAQNWLNRIANDYRQRHQQRTPQRYNRQQTYQNRQPSLQQERANRQRLETQERGYQRQQSVRSNASSNFSASSNSQVSNMSQGNENVVALVVNGTGKTKDEAIQNALRSAIEQAYGTFVSSNTEVLNDELVKDDIVTVSFGNIANYKELSSSQLTGDHYEVSLRAVVSIDKLTSFAQSRGMSTELLGASYAMNVRLRELNKRNEDVALTNLRNELLEICKKGLYDYQLKTSEPQINGNVYLIELAVSLKKNENGRYFDELYDRTLSALSLSYDEYKDYQRTNSNCLQYGKYYLRNDYITHLKITDISTYGMTMFYIEDNLGNRIYVDDNASPQNGRVLMNSGYNEYSVVLSGNIPFKVLRGIDLHGNCRILLQYRLDQLEKLSQIRIVPTNKIPNAYRKLAYLDKKLDNKTISETDAVETEPIYVRPGYLEQKIGSTMRYPVLAAENGVFGTVKVSFVVKSDGTLNDIRIAKGVDPSLDKEALRVVNLLNDGGWIPAKQNGKNVDFKKTVELSFSLN